MTAGGFSTYYPLGSTIIREPVRAEDSVITISDTNEFGFSEELVRIKANGELVYGPNYTPTAAAKAFWEAIQALNPNSTRAMIVATLDEIERRKKNDPSK